MLLIALFTFHLQEFLPVLGKTNECFARISMLSEVRNVIDDGQNGNCRVLRKGMFLN